MVFNVIQWLYYAHLVEQYQRRHIHDLLKYLWMFRKIENVRISGFRDVSIGKKITFVVSKLELLGEGNGIAM